VGRFVANLDEVTWHWAQLRVEVFAQVFIGN